MARITAGLRALTSWWAASLLGLVAIGTYGVALYSLGVLIEPIHLATGWSRGALSTAFSVGAVGSALGAAVAGRVLDRVGGRPVLAVVVIAGTGFVLLSAEAESLLFFVVTWGLGCAIVGAGGFYHVTMALSARRHPDNTAKAFAILTFIGGLASPLYLPLTATAIDWWGWQGAVRMLACSLPLTVLPALLFVGVPRSTDPAGDEPAPPPVSVRQAYRTRHVLQTVSMLALSRMASTAIQVYQVPVMAGAGLTLAAAANAAAVRGLLSLPGRAMLSPLVNRLGVLRSLVLVHVITLVGLGALGLAGPFGFVVAYVALTGLAFGTMLPLAGLFSIEVYGGRRVGTMLGMEQMIVGLGAASGPVLIGSLVDATGGYTAGLITTGALWVASVSLMLTMPRDGTRP